MSTLKTSNIANLSGTSTSVENVLNGTAKCWVNFNGTGTVAIRASYNVSSITDNGTGDYTVNFTNAMVDTSYSSIPSGANSGNSILIQENLASIIKTTTQLRILSWLSNTGAVTDASYVSVAIFR